MVAFSRALEAEEMVELIKRAGQSQLNSWQRGEGKQRERAACSIGKVEREAFDAFTKSWGMSRKVLERP